MSVNDRWHKKRRPHSAPELCAEHGFIPSKAHGVGKRWEVRYRDPDDRQRTELFATKVKADKRDRNIRTKLDAGTYIDPDAGKVLFADYARQWLDDGVYRDSTRALYERLLRLHILPAVGRAEMNTILPGKAERWVKVWNRDLGASQARQCHTITSRIFNSAVKDRIINDSPLRDMRIAPVPGSRAGRYFPDSMDEIRPMLEVLPPDMRVLQTLVLGTGMRIGEVLGLDVHQLDFDRNEVFVNQQLTYLTKRGHSVLYFDKVKTDAAERTIPLPKFVTEALAEHMEAHPPQCVTLPWGSAAGRKHGSQLVFHNGGKAVLRSTCTNRIRNALGSHGFPQGATPHVVRHLYESLLADEGIPQVAIDRYMGHKPMGSVGQQRYQHVLKGAADRVRSALDDLWVETKINPNVRCVCDDQGQ